MNKAVFLDRDGVIIKSNIVKGKPFAIRSISELEFFDNVLHQLNRLKEMQFLLVIVTNQPDIKKGLISNNTLELINKKIMEYLPIDSIKVCSELENEYSGNYKPEPGMLIQASKELNINLEKSYMIGDRWRDVGAGYNAGCKTILIDYNYSERLIFKPDFTTFSLYEAVNIIIQNESY